MSLCFVGHISKTGIAYMNRFIKVKKLRPYISLGEAGIVIRGLNIIHRVEEVYT